MKTPEYLVPLREELTAALKQTDNAWSFDIFKHTPKLESFTKECLRVFTPAAIIEIMRDKRSEDLEMQIIQGLQFDSLQLPQDLLWDDAGQTLFDELCNSSAYYLTRKENEILQKNSSDMAATIAEGSALIELGCGSLRKSGIILSALEKAHKAVTYYALDVSQESLQNGLAQLHKGLGDLDYVELRGLWGTYEDGIAWLADQHPLTAHKSITFLWMGNSMTNMHLAQTQSLLSRMADTCIGSGIQCQLLVSVDSCSGEDIVMGAYNRESPPLKDFIMNGLQSANRILGHDVFCASDWTFDTVLDRVRNQVQVFYTPTRDVSIHINSQPCKITKGEKVAVISSGKWPEPYFRSMVEGIGMQVLDVWRDSDQFYSSIRQRTSRERKSGSTLLLHIHNYIRPGIEGICVS
ncbi:histidine-specific methyltransferase [Aspergillus pseudocaelatus]|uniref:Histidine-specific methyltransferase n=1 Tax=Aspergillus pseudocaelatus TaxID=1825620 RepID=A0ABQ6W4K5_9EURO|nr:histidine-specific methyltransferase [Aspergillus pseudocaelatus]